LVVSQLVVEELEDVLRNKLSASKDAFRRSELLLENAEVVKTPQLTGSADETNDSRIIQAAAAAEIDVLVTGDFDMQSRASALGLLPVSPRGFLELLALPRDAYPTPDDEGNGPLVSEPQSNPIKEKSFAFALEVVNLYQCLQDQREYVLSKQILRSGTSIGANVEEATAAESRADFIHKMKIAMKESRETHYWLRLLDQSEMIGDIDLTGLLSQADELSRMLTSITKTASENAKCRR